MKFKVLFILFLMMLSAAKADTTLPLLNQTSFSFEGSGYIEYVYSVNETVLNMTHAGQSFQGIGLFFKNDTNAEFSYLRVVAFRNENRIPAPTFNEYKRLNPEDPDLFFYPTSPRGNLNNFYVGYPFAQQDQNGDWLDDPKSLKLVLYYFGNQKLNIDLDIYFLGSLIHRNSVSTFNQPLPISIMGIFVGLLLRKRKA